MEQNERIKDGVKNGISSATRELNDAADCAINKASELGSRFVDKAQKFTNEAADKTNQTLSSVGQKMNDFAGTVRNNLPNEGKLGSAACAVADTLESSGQYLANHDLGSIEKDVVSLVRKYPLYSIGAGVLFGVLVSKMMPRR